MLILEYAYTQINTVYDLGVFFKKYFRNHTGAEPTACVERQFGFHGYVDLHSYDWERERK